MAKQLGFGLVTLPVKLVTTAVSRDIAFNNVLPNGHRVKGRSFDVQTNEDVTGYTPSKGYELNKSQYVVLSQDEVKACAPAKDDLIEVTMFVDEGEIDPLLYEKNRYVVPEKGAAKPYSLLVEAMSGTGKVGVARMVEGSKEQLVVVRVVGKAMVLSTLFYSDEFKPAADLGLVDVDHTPDELKLAKMLIEAKAGKFKLEDYSDSYRVRLMELIVARAENAEAPAPAPVEAPVAGPSDLMAALKASIEASAKPAAAKKAVA